MKRVEGIDITRGLLALSIAFYHYIQFLDITWMRQFHPIISAGLTSVDGFFMISGFALYYSYHTVDFSIPENTKHYFYKRFARIAPLFYLCMIINIISPPLILAVLALIFFLGFIGEKLPSTYWVKIPFVTITLIIALLIIKPHSESYDRILLLNNVSFLFGFLNPNLTTVRGGWSIGIEYIFYFLFPFILCFTKNEKKFILLIAFVSLFLGLNYQCLNNTHLFSYHAQGHQEEIITNWPLYTNPLNHMYFFMAGMILFLFYERYYSLICNNQPLLYKTLFILLCVYCIADKFVGDPSHGKGRIIYSVLTISIVSITPFISIKEGFVKRMLISLGDISYSTYLVQFPVYTVISYYCKTLHIPPFIQLLVMLISLIGIAYLTYNLYEMPTKKWLTKIRLQPSPDPMPLAEKINYI